MQGRSLDIVESHGTVKLRTEGPTRFSFHENLKFMILKMKCSKGRMINVKKRKFKIEICLSSDKEINLGKCRNQKYFQVRGLIL